MGDGVPDGDSVEKPLLVEVPLPDCDCDGEGVALGTCVADALWVALRV